MLRAADQVLRPLRAWANAVAAYDFPEPASVPSSRSDNRAWDFPEYWDEAQEPRRELRWQSPARHSSKTTRTMAFSTWGAQRTILVPTPMTSQCELFDHHCQHALSKHDASAKVLLFCLTNLRAWGKRVRSECTITYFNMHGRGHIQSQSHAGKVQSFISLPRLRMATVPGLLVSCKKLHDIAQNSVMPICVNPSVLSLPISARDRSSRIGANHSRGTGANV
jgi:hypothetical protein